jgi:hypothetical protein
VNALTKAKVIVEVNKATENGARFASVQYRTIAKYDKDGKLVDGNELSRYRLLLGCSVENAYRADITRLSKRLARLEKLPQLDTLRQAAISEILASRKESLAVGIGNNSKYTLVDTFESIAPGIKMHKESGELYLFGRSLGKTVIEPGVHKHVNSAPLTIAKRKESATLPGGKWRTFRVSIENLRDIRANGKTLEIVAA